MLYSKNTKNEKRPTALLLDLQALAAVWKVGAGSEVEGLTHHCWVEEGSDVHRAGARVGAPCCSNRDEMIEQMAVPFLNLVVHRPYTRSAQSRWTAVLSMLRKITLGFACAGVLPAAVKELLLSWRLHEGLIADLQRMVALDGDDWASKNKLRLLRVTQGFSGKAPLFALALELTMLTAVDSMLTEILGQDGFARADMSKLVDEGA